MRSILLACFSILFAANLHAQTTAQDFTKKDCDGNDHHLFSELESGKVIILEYIMDCSSCSNAAKSLKTVVDNFETKNPGRVKLYSIAYNNTYTCADMQDWKTSNGLTLATVFTNGASDVSYYGGFGMPTIVVVGGNDHKVFYKTKAYSTSENTKITTAIENALQSTSGVEDVTNTVNNFQVYPNPANTNLTISFGDVLNQNVQLSITDVSGKQIKAGTYNVAAKNINVDVTEIPAGIYFLNIKSELGISTQKIYITK